MRKEEFKADPNKRPKSKLIKPVVEKYNNMFIEWRNENINTYKKMLQEDISFWKLNRFIKD